MGSTLLIEGEVVVDGRIVDDPFSILEEGLDLFLGCLEVVIPVLA